MGVSATSKNGRATILVVDDDPSVASTLSGALELSGYRVVCAPDGVNARRLLEEARPDLIVLDLILPDVDGLVLCSMLKSLANVPIVICSGTNRKRDAILGLKLGADDFVPKPFDIDDLEARIEAVLRRSRSLPAAEPPAKAGRIQVGDLVIETTRRRVTLGGDALQLTPTEYRLLSTLAREAGEVLSREELAQSVWGYQDASSGRTIDVHIRRLRMKLSDSVTAPPDIVSVRGFGYKLVKPEPNHSTAAA